MIRPALGTVSPIFIAGIALTAVVIYFGSQYLKLSYQNRLTETALVTTNGVTSLITDRLNHYRTMVSSVANHHQERIFELAAGGGYPYDVTQVSNDLDTLFRDVDQFAILDQKGKPMVVSKGQPLGAQCKHLIENEFQTPSSTGEIELHRNGKHYHFDVIVKLDRGNQHAALLVSFSLERFQKLLSQFDSPELELVLVRAASPKVPVLSSSSMSLNEDLVSFTDKQLKKALAVEKVEHTRWLLLGLPSSGLFSKHAEQVNYVAWSLFLVALLLFMAFLYYLKRANEARFHAEQKASYSALFNAGPTVLFEKDFQAGMSIEYVSPNVLQLLGFTDSELMAERSFYDLIHPKDLQNFKYSMLQAIQNHAPSFELEYRLMCADWHYIWVYSLVHLNRDGREKVQKVQGYITSIQAQKLAEQQATTLIENAPDAMVVTDDSGRIQSVNKMAESMFGYLKDELIGQSMSRLIPSYADALEWQSEPQITPYRECVGETRSGRELALGVSLSRLQTSGGVVIATVIRDVSVQKAAEEQMMLAKDRAEALALARSRFLAMISHEIRTPMNGVLGMADLLIDTPLNETQQTYLDAIRESGRSLISILNDVLDFSKLEQGGIQIYEEPFNLHESVNNSVRLLTPLAKLGEVALQQSLDADCPVWVKGDALRLRQILLNLVGNAIKFSPKGQVLLNVSILKEDEVSYYLQFSVQDNGIGIAKEHHKGLFEPFIQVDNSTSRHFGGTGLGLAITKQLVDLMDGTIRVVSELGQGSTFIVELPFHKADDVEVSNADSVDSLPEAIVAQYDTRIASSEPLLQRKRRKSQEEGDKPLKRVLLVEDDPTNQQIAEAFIHKLGLEVDVVNNGLEALEFWRLHHDKFGLILMDCQMPIMDGYEASQLIRHEEVQLNTKDQAVIIAFTANAYEEERNRCLNAGMDDLLVKPLFVEEFREKLYKWFPELKMSGADQSDKVEN